MRHVMVDLETMSSKNNAAILSIGAILFDPNTGETGPTFSANVDPETCEEAGLHISASTFVWWLNQSDAARQSFQKDQVSLRTALTTFAEWLGQNTAGESPYVWGNGATFDNVVLRNAYDAISLRAPWHWSMDRCFRTMKAEFKTARPAFKGTAHKAVDDAVNQAEHLIAIYAKIRGGTNVAVPQTTPTADSV